jgi:enoyl-CoA hydratase
VLPTIDKKGSSMTKPSGVASPAPPAVLVDRDGHVAIITLNRPEKRNALDPAMAAQLIRACDDIDTDDSVGAVVLRGAGGSFCAGAERSVLDDASRDPVREDLYDMLGSVYEAFMRVGSLRAPVVAAIRGAAVGAGVNLALAADLRIVAEDARFIAGFLRIGIHPGGGNFKLTARVAGREAAAALSVFGEELSGARAAQIGMAWQALPDDEVEAKALAIAARTGSDPELARLATKTFRTHTDQGFSWDVAMSAERISQVWSLRRRFAAQAVAASG